MSDNQLLEKMQAILEQLDQQGEQPSQEDTPSGDTERGKTVINVFFIDESTTEEEPESQVTVESTLTPSDRIPPTREPISRRVKPATKRTKGNALLSLAVFCVCLLLSLALMFIFIIPSFLPIATVTIQPAITAINTIATIQLVSGTPTGDQIHGSLLAPLTLSQSEQVKASGHRHQDATRAEGTITFYNGLFTSQTVAAGTVLIGSDGVQVAIDQAAVIPAGNPPIYGQLTVSAHAVSLGSQGNIAAYDINEACCLTSVLAKNTDAFQGGLDARNFTVVTKADISNVATSLKTTLDQSEHAALTAQLTPGEGLVTPPCSQQIQSDHQPGDEADMVQVTVSETCEAVVYTAHDLYQDATQMITKEAVKRFGTAYSLIGNIAVSVLHTTIADHTRGIAMLAVKGDATYIYQITPGEKQRITKLIAGKTKQQAIHLLEALPGIQGAAITMQDNAATLPEDPTRIHITVLYRVV